MSYVPLKSSRNLVVYKNGQLYESSITLDFMLLTTAQANKFSELLNSGSSDLTNASNIGFWADGYLPTNPIFTPAELSIGLNLGSKVSALCFSDYLYNVLLNIGDEIIIYNADFPNEWGIGFRYYQTIDNARKVLDFIYIIRGTKKYTTTPLTIGTRGSGASLEYWRFFFGVMMDKENNVAYPFVVHGYYHIPNDRYDVIRVSTIYPTASDFTLIKEGAYKVFSNLPPEPTPDPYPSDNYDEPIQGEGNFDDSSDTIDIPTTPSLTVTSSRLVSIYTPSAQQIEELAARLIDPNIFQALANTIEDISACVIGLHIVPLVVPYTVPDRQLCMNFMGLSLGLGVYLNKATVQFLDVDCGTLEVNEYWGNCLDYSPYTRISIFLPFCGYYDIETDEVMGKELKVKYRVDIASGSCIAFIIVNGSVLYQYTGNCSQQIPVTSADFNSFLGNAFNVAVATATSGASVAAAGSAVTEANTLAGSKGASADDILGAVDQRAQYDSVKTRAEGRIGGAVVNAVVNSKPHFNHGGSLSGSSGFLGCKKPYLIITRPNPMIPDMYGKFHGYPCNTTVVLGDLIGYTEVADIRLNIPEATVDEIIECEKLLKDGVVL